MPEYIDITPDWEPCVRVYMAVLHNPNAPDSAKHSAEEEILRLARFVDELNRKNKEETVTTDDNKGYSYCVALPFSTKEGARDGFKYVSEKTGIYVGKIVHIPYHSIKEEE